jgi:hypothetical protein
MTRKEITLICIALILGSSYAYFFTDWINRPVIQIMPQNRPLNFRPMGPAPSRVFPISFTLDGTYKLTAIKVIPVTALQTNKHPVPVWFLTTKSNSVPTKGFLYGLPIPGMRPVVTNARPQGLEPGVSYRVLVDAGRAHGEADFSPKAIPGS